MDLALSLLHWLGITLYGGPLVAFAVLLHLRNHLAPLSSEGVVRAFRAWGAGFGLSMGALIFSGLVLRWRLHGGFSWPTDTGADQLRAASSLVFMVLWVSSFHLEIWTLEPCRKLDKDGAIVDRADFEAAADRVSRQATFNALLFVLIGALALAARI